MTADSPIHQLGGRPPVDAAPGIVREDAAATLAKGHASNHLSNRPLEAVDLHGAHDFRHTYATWLEDARIPALLSTSGVMTAGVPQADGSLRLEPQI
jgi:integrase